MSVKRGILLTYHPVELCRQVPAIQLEPQIHSGHNFFIQSELVVIYNVDGVRHIDVVWWKVQALCGWTNSFQLKECSFVWTV
jgi:hypothetical protein